MTLVTSEISKKIDLFIEKVIEVMVKELDSNYWMGVKIMRRVLRQGKFYPSMYINEIGGHVLKPNTDKVTRLFKL